jgi:hypothetical protein
MLVIFLWKKLYWLPFRFASLPDLFERPIKGMQYNVSHSGSFFTCIDYTSERHVCRAVVVGDIKTEKIGTVL